MIYFELDAGTATGCCAKWTFNSQNSFAVRVFKFVVWKQRRPFLFDTSNDSPWWHRYFYGLKTAWKTATWTCQWTMEMKNLIFVEIQNLHFEWTTIAITISNTTIRIFSNHKNLVQNRRGIDMMIFWFPIEWCNFWYDSLTFWSTLFLTMYLLLISHWHITSQTATFCSITNSSRVLRYSRPCGQCNNPFEELMSPSIYGKIEANTKMMIGFWYHPNGDIEYICSCFTHFDVRHLIWAGKQLEVMLNKNFSFEVGDMTALLTLSAPAAPIYFSEEHSKFKRILKNVNPLNRNKFLERILTYEVIDCDGNVPLIGSFSASDAPLELSVMFGFYYLEHS